MLNQSYHLGLARTIVARIEQPVEPGQPRRYWDGTANAWSSSPASRVLLIPDPDQLGSYLLQIPSAITAAWPDGIYRIALLDVAISGPDQLISDPWTILIVGGDDGGLGYPSVIMNATGGTITLFGARFNHP